MCNAIPYNGKTEGLRSLGSTGEFSMGVLTETKKTPRLSRGGPRPDGMTVRVASGCVSVGGDAQRPCPVVRSWELATIFYFLAGIFSLTGA